MAQVKIFGVREQLNPKKKLIRLLFDRIQEHAGIEFIDLEICIYESPACNWGFREMHGDEIQLSYEIKV
ncbi:MAG: hypothetical protein ACI96M_001165 [Candidatus Azotimanducaceae bacterium]|jgi:hypothetical protein